MGAEFRPEIMRLIVPVFENHVLLSIARKRNESAPLYQYAGV